MKFPEVQKDPAQYQVVFNLSKRQLLMLCHISKLVQIEHKLYQLIVWEIT